MSSPDATSAKAFTLVHVDSGQLSVAPNASAPLLVVFGGIDVDAKYVSVEEDEGNNPVPSGDYMWKYMKNVTDCFHVFVASNCKVNGSQAYQSLMATIKELGLTPSKQILYLFSGGYRPGRDLLDPKNGGPGLFAAIYLVDIYMRAGEDVTTVVDGKPKKWFREQVPNWIRALVGFSAATITYVYTAYVRRKKNGTQEIHGYGPQNDKAMQYIVDAVGGRATMLEIPKVVDPTPYHMDTNTTAVSDLQLKAKSHIF